MSFWKELFGGIKSAFTGNPLGTIGSAFSMAMGLGETKRQKKLMDYQDKINDANYQREREDKLADYQMQLADQKAMIADERNYNDIGSQMQRARNAGVSPLAALGVSSGSTLSAVSPVQGTSSQGVSQGSNNSSSHFSNAITLATTLKELKLRDKQLQIEKARADADVAKTVAETKAINERMPFISQEAQETVNNLIKDGKYKQAQEVLLKAETKLKEQEHEQKGEFFDYEKRESDSRTKLNNAHANKASFEDWYQRTHHRTMSNGMAHLIDTISDSLWSGQPGADARADGRDATTRIGEIFDKLKSIAGYFSDESLFEYAKLIYGWFKDKGISFGPTKR